MPRYDYDLVTIGAGSGGVRASRLAGGYGARVAVVEKSRVGGTCVMRGCIPKKLLVYGAHFAEDFEDARGYGWSIEGARLDWGALVAAKERELHRLEGVYRDILTRNSVSLIEGEAVLTDQHTVSVDGKRITAEAILIACGGWPVLPDIPGIEYAITSNEALDLPDLPKRVVVVGGGYIALEFCGIFRAAGAQVTEVIRGTSVLRGFDEDVARHVSDEMRARDVSLRTETLVRSINRNNDGLIVELNDRTVLAADVVLFATGREPATAPLGLQAVGVTLMENGAVMVDDWQRSTVSNIFAVGDCTDRLNLTPVAIAEGRAFAETRFNNNPMTADYHCVPTAVFSQPPVACVGLTEGQAQARGAIDVYTSTFRPLKHTLSGRNERTFMKLIVDRDSQKVLGCHMVGTDAPEIMQGLAIALKCGATKAQFDSVIGIHPTAAEEFVTMREKRSS